MSEMQGIYPAVVKGYDPITRMCRVDIPAITGGGDGLPLAEIAYPIGDKSQGGRKGVVTTEIEILPEDPVWVMFINGDPTHPIITHFRNPRAGNDVGTRRIHHANIDVLADGTLNIAAANINLTGNIKLNGNVAASDGQLTHNGVNVGSTHHHNGVQAGGAKTGNPI